MTILEWERTRDQPKISKTPAFAPPLITGPYPQCEDCTWVFRPGMTLNRDNAWVLKFRNRCCGRHYDSRIEVIQP